MAKDKITQPTQSDEALLDEIARNSTDYVKVRNKRYGIKWIKAATRRRMTHLFINAKDDDNALSCKAAALFVLNGYWAIKFRYWYLWRWFYYIRQYDEAELSELLALAKKKVQLESYYVNITLLTAMKDTAMMMTKAEVNATLQEHSTGNGAKSAKSDRG